MSILSDIGTKIGTKIKELTSSKLDKTSTDSLVLTSTEYSARFNGGGIQILPWGTTTSADKSLSMYNSSGDLLIKQTGHETPKAAGSGNPKVLLTYNGVNRELYHSGNLPSNGTSIVVGFHADGGATQNLTTAYNVDFGTSRIDTHSGWNGSTRYTCKVSGTYLINYGWMTYSTNANRHVLRKNGVSAFVNQYAEGNIYDRIAFSGLLYLGIGDYIEVCNNVSANIEGHKHGGYDYFNAVLQG